MDDDFNDNEPFFFLLYWSEFLKNMDMRKLCVNSTSTDETACLVLAAYSMSGCVAEKGTSRAGCGRAAFSSGSADF